MNVAVFMGLIMAVTAQSQAQEEKKSKAECVSKGDYEKTSFQVDGVCGMCQSRIEKAAKEAKGVKKAKWDKESHMLSLAYHKKKADLNDVHKKIAAAGHNTEKVKATKQAYNSLPNCCRYKEE